MASVLDRFLAPRAAISNSPPVATVATVATVEGGARGEPAPAPLPGTRRLYLIRHADGALASHSFTPGATPAEVRAWYPDATSIEPEDEPTEME
jgi:hypothetical protein